jgi:DNA-binding LytR/AlgR family response regulator
MNCIVIDDEPLARLGMETHIKNLPKLNLIGSFSNPLDATDTLQKGTVDLIFLDINMPEISGLEYVKTLVNSSLVIFATAYPQYALDSYELDAIDYLLKPIRFDRFVKAVNKATSYHELLKSKEGQQNEIKSVSDGIIYIKSDRKFFKLNLTDILFIEGLKDYVIIHTENKKIVTAMNLKTIMAQLPESDFARISKSYIVNIHHIISFDTFSVYFDKSELPIGTSFKDDFFQRFSDKIVLRK